ncbi:MAG TPA: response regulator [Vicinamibacterales bacterium]|nr:response regulator [Vicinamibacterales bacterium]
MTILVVEDDVAVLTLVERLLTAKGHTVLTAHDPQDAEFVLGEHGQPPDLLLADIVLDGAIGVDYARTLKRKYPPLKIVFMTGLAHRAPAALRTGLGPVLHKPFAADELYRIINEL